MIWLTWRQFRSQALTALAILAAAAIYFLITGLQMHHAYSADLAACTPHHDCGLSPFAQSYNTAFDLTQLLVIAAPGLIGIFWGAPLIGRELETGTDQLAWTQSVTRTRWLAVKLAGVGVASIATAAVLSYLLTWWAGPLDHISGNRFAAMTFSSRDIVPLAYAAFAFALGTTAGLLLRRTLPAMAVTLAVFIGIQILVATFIRPSLLPSTTVTFPVDKTTVSQSAAIGTRDGGNEIYITGLPVPQGRVGGIRPAGGGLLRPGGHLVQSPPLLHRYAGPCVEGRARRRQDRRLPCPLRPAPKRHLPARAILLAAPVV